MTATAGANDGLGWWKANVIVVPKAGVNDPQGEAIRGGLGSLGYGNVGSVRSGRYFQVTLQAEDESAAMATAAEMCERLLANPVIETFTLAVEPGGSSTASQAIR